MSKMYTYEEISCAGRSVTNIKKENVVYIPFGQLTGEENVIGYTKFEKVKTDKDSLLLGNKTYLVKDIRKHGKIEGYIKTTDGDYIAFYHENEIFWLIFFIAWVLLMFGLIFLDKNKHKNENIINEDSKTEFNIGGIEGTEVNLSKDGEVSYNTYWGYQSIIIDETMKVPFVNKETNTAYAIFTLSDKNGNVIYESEYIPPGNHAEWDAYSYYSGQKGEYLHDLKVTFHNPVYDKTGRIVDFKVSMFAANTPDFGVTIQ